MANSYTVLANLRAGRCSNKAEVRLLRFWDAKNIKGGKLISLEMLLIDEESTLVQGTVSAALSGIFRERLSEGSIYTLSGFDVTRSSPKYRLSDGPISIRFNEGTAFQKLATTTRVLPTEHFRFQPYDHILELANSGKQLPDVMGELRAIRSTITDSLPGPSRVMLTLCMEGDVNIVVSIFDSLAFAFHSKLDGYGREPRIVLVTAINPKIFSGKLYLNGTSATRVFFDSETAVGKIAFDRLTGGGTDEGGPSSKMVRAQKIEPISLAELNQFVITGDPQTIEFLCTAKITEVQLSEGWCYIGCATCSKKLIREESSFTCAPCNQTNAVAELKYRVVFSVSDDTDIAYFTGFDEEIAKLTHVLASEAAQIVGVGVNAEVDTELPRSLAPVVGNTYTFHLKLKDFNFTANHQTFTISRIYPAPELAPTPTFAEAEENVVPVAAGTGAVRDAAPVALTNTTAEQSSTSGGPLEGRQAADGEDVVLEESATKKARVE